MGVVLVQVGDSFPGEGLGESNGVAAGLADMGVVQEPVNGCCGQGLGHQFVEAGGAQIRADGGGAFFVGGVHDPVESFGGVGGHREQADVVDHDELGAEDSGHGIHDAVVRAVRTDQGAEVFESEPRHADPGLDGLLAERASRKNVFPVPEGRQTTTFSLRVIRSKVRGACRWVPGSR